MEEVVKVCKDDVVNIHKPKVWYDRHGTIHVTKEAGRNDPCPCGSGKKYKKCCMNKDKGYL